MKTFRVAATVVCEGEFMTQATADNFFRKDIVESIQKGRPLPNAKVTIGPAKIVNPKTDEPAKGKTKKKLQMEAKTEAKAKPKTTAKKSTTTKPKTSAKKAAPKVAPKAEAKTTAKPKGKVGRPKKVAA